MKKNMGTLDRSIRTILALLVAVLYFTGQISGTAAIILGIIAVVFSSYKYCFFLSPVYLP